MRAIKLDLPFILLLSAILFFVIVIRDDLAKNAYVTAQNEKIKNDIILESQKKKLLNEEIRSFKRSNDIELIARKKLMMAKKGEKLYKLIP